MVWALQCLLISSILLIYRLYTIRNYFARSCSRQLHQLPIIPRITEQYSLQLEESFTHEVQHLITSRKRLQHNLAGLYYRSHHSRLSNQNSFGELNVIHRQYQSHRLASQSIGTAWLLAIPNSGLNQAMDSIQFRVALCFHLFIPLVSADTTCPQCGNPADRFGYRTLVCGGHGNLIQARHEIVASGLCQIRWFQRTTQRQGDMPREFQ